MSDEIVIQQSYQADIRPPHLSRTQWRECEEKARRAVIDSVPKPTLEYTQQIEPVYPKWLTALLLAGLSIVAIGALYVSAGKQLAAGDIVLSSVLLHTNRVNQFWVSSGLIVLVLMGEIGALVFGLSAGLLANNKSAKRVFRFFMIMSAAIALLANISMTANYPQNEVLVFQWFVTLLAPSIVLGVGFVLENMLLRELERRAERYRAYQAALEFYQRVLQDPKTALPERYQVELYHAIGEALLENCKTSDGKRGALYKRYLETIEADPRFELQCIIEEFNRHSITLNDFLTRPT